MIDELVNTEKVWHVMHLFNWNSVCWAKQIKNCIFLFQHTTAILQRSL